MKWTQEKDDDLTKLFENDYSDEEIADYFGLDEPMIVTRRRYRLRLLRRAPRGGWPNRWTEKEDRIIKNTMHMKAEDVAKRMKKSKHAIDYRRKELKLKSSYFVRWEPWQLRVLREHYIPRGPRYVAEKTGFTTRKVITKASQEGLRRRR